MRITKAYNMAVQAALVREREADVKAKELLPQVFEAITQAASSGEFECSFPTGDRYLSYSLSDLVAKEYGYRTYRYTDDPSHIKIKWAI